MKIIIPEKLKTGDEARVVAPSMSLSLLSEQTKQIANQRFADLGLKLSFGKHIKKTDDFGSSSAQSRVEDLHNAFANKNVKAIITVIGGQNSNQLLQYLDWDLIKNNPKIFCGFSDITALNNAIFAKTGLVNYSGPHYSSFGQKLYFDYTLDYFKKCLFTDEPFEIAPSQKWSDDAWYINQEGRNLIDNQGLWLVNQGQAQGVILGANLCTFNLLQGAEYFPDLNETILFLEDDEQSLPHTFDRDLQSLIHQPDFSGVRGIVIGRFQKASKMDKHKLEKIIKSKKDLLNIPIIANADFGHTDPKITFPIGGIASIQANAQTLKIKIITH